MMMNERLRHLAPRCQLLLLAVLVVGLVVSTTESFQPSLISNSLVPRRYQQQQQHGSTIPFKQQQQRNRKVSLQLVSPEITDAMISSASSLSSLSTNLVSAITDQFYPTSPEPIHTAFTIATFLPQPFWLLMILLPNNKITKTIMGGLEIPLLCCLIHFFIVASSIGMDGTGVTAPLSEFNDVFEPAGDPQLAFMGMTTKYPNFVAEEWSHVLTWDIFIGRYIWIDGIKRNIFTPHSVLLSNLIGPPGLLLHWLTCTVFYKKPILDPSEKEQLMNTDVDSN